MAVAYVNDDLVSRANGAVRRRYNKTNRLNIPKAEKEKTLMTYVRIFVGLIQLENELTSLKMPNYCFKANNDLV